MFYTTPGKGFIGFYMLHKVFLKVFCVLCTLLFSIGNALAFKTDTLHYTLEETTVLSSSRESAPRHDVPQRNIGRSDILSLGLHTLSDAVKRMPGVVVNDYGGVGGLKTVSVRGMGAKHTAVSYDGVVLSNAQSGMVDLGRFGLENIEAVSLTMGQGGDVVPSTARELQLSNLISLTTLREQNNLCCVKLQGGSFGLLGASAYAIRNNVASYSWCSVERLSFYGDYSRSDGAYPFTLVNGSSSSREKRSNGDSESLVLEGNTVLALFGGEFAAKVHYYGSERGLPGAVNLYNKENRERLCNRNFFAQSVFKRDLGSRHRFQALFKYDYNYSRYTDISDNYALGRQTDINRQNELYASLSLAGNGLGRFAYSLAADAGYTTLSNNFPDSRSPRRLSFMGAVSGRYSREWWQLTLSLFAMYQRDAVAAGNAPGAYKRVSPSASLVVTPIADYPLYIRLSFKDAYRVPTFADLYYLRLGNVGLKPERATQYNMGVTWELNSSQSLNRLSLSVDAYYNNVRDKIVALPTMYVWRMMNFGRAAIYGVDLNLSGNITLSRFLSLDSSLGYSWQYAVDVTDSSSKNYRHQLPYTPRHSGLFSLTLRSPLLNLSYMLTAVGERYMLPQNTARNRMSGYLEHSFSANREFALGSSMSLRLQGELLNVGNEQYEVIRYYPMPGFSWRLSARLYF